MIPGIQIIGIIFALIMLYFTYVYYKRKNYGYRSLILWGIVWLGVLFLVTFPQIVYGIMGTLQIQRTADFFVMAGFVFFSIIIFHLYITVKKNNEKMEKLVKNIAKKEKKKY
ncbi:DUF2304 domain-containing protein [Candidatus Woesearchaeota archaeon]|nr:DUF2304 domain-containing protein [Candidatus Woesearchaeota archaeon]